MKFSCPLICGLILSCISLKVTDSHEDEELSVNQSPSSITVKEGDSAQITCCWNNSKNQIKVNWFINKTKRLDVEHEHNEYKTHSCSVLRFTNILKNASSVYYCQVIQDIPVLIVKMGSGTDLFVSDSTTEISTTVKPDEKDEKPNYLGPKGSSRGVVIIYIFRSLPFICLLVAFFYLNRDDKRVRTSRPAVEHAVELGEGPDENQEAGETQRNKSEEVKQSENVSEREKERVNTEKPEVTAATEEKVTTVVASIEQGASPEHDAEHKNSSVLNTNEKTHRMTDGEEGMVSVLGDVVSVL